MLVLSRKVGEVVVINSDIYITILSTIRGTVRLGVQAPLGVEVDRQELRQQKLARKAVGKEQPQ